MKQSREAWHGPAIHGMKLRPEIMTVSGKYFNFLDCDPDTYDINDIAHALSMLCRYTGHTKLFYSVAQHSVMVSQLVPKEHALAGLLHDAAEFVLGDVSSPLKQLLPDYKMWEKHVEKAIFKKFGLPESLPPTIKVADVKMLATEQRDLMGAGAEDWIITENIKPLPEPIKPMSSAQAYAVFLTRYRDITGGSV